MRNVAKRGGREGGGFKGLSKVGLVGWWVELGV